MVNTIQTPTDALEGGHVCSKGQWASPFEGILGQETSALETQEMLIKTSGKDSDTTPNWLS